MEAGLIPELQEEQTVRGVLREMLDQWENIVVRVRQDGKRAWMPLSEVRDEQQAARVVIDLIKSAMKGVGRP